MKNYKQLLKELPSKTVVFAFGRFQPPTIGHELLVKAVKKVAGNHADHVIYASRTQDKKKNPLPVDRKVYFLQRMFPGVNFKAANEQERTFIEVAKSLNKKYKNIIMIAGSDRVPEYEKILNKYNGKEFHFDTVQVVSAGERDPDADDASGMSGTKMRDLASKGDFVKFKTGLPKTMTTQDAKRLMNEIRQGMGEEPLRESFKFQTDQLREDYRAGTIFKVGQIVEDSSGSKMEIMDRGPNYITVVNSNGELSKRWLSDVKLVEHTITEDIENPEEHNQISYKGYLTKHFDKSPGAVAAFNNLIHKGADDPVAVLNAIKSTDEYLAIIKGADATKSASKETLTSFNSSWDKAREALQRANDLDHHTEYMRGHKDEIEAFGNDYPEEHNDEQIEESMEFKPADKIKVARIIANALGIDNVDEKSSPEMLVNTAIRGLKSKRLTPDSMKILGKMLTMATDAGIKWDKNSVPAATLKAMGITDGSLAEEQSVVKDVNSTRNLAKGIMSYSDFKKSLAMNQGKVGAAMTGETDNDHVRKMKVKHVTEEEQLKEAEEKDEDPCWDGYEQIGMKKKNGKKVPNCVPVKEESEDFEDLEDTDLDDMVKSVNDIDDVIDAYEDDELALVDDETGEEVEDEELKEETLQEVLSRVGRLRRKIQFAKTKSKRERMVKIALRKVSNSQTINSRARKLAVQLMKKRLARGRDIASLSIPEKERLEKVIEKRKAVIARLATRLAPRVRQIEKARLSHSKFTGKQPNAQV